MNQLIICISLLLASLPFAPRQTHADDLTLANIFADHMVLQREANVPIWGQAKAGTRVTVRFNDQEATSTADTDGNWQVSLSPMTADSEGQVLTVSADGVSVTIHNIVIGEVWFAGGQSNMAFTMQGMARKLAVGEEMIADANFSLIRMRRLRNDHAREPADDLPERIDWTTCSPESVGQFSAVAYVFARRLYLELEVPIGIMDCSWGGKPIEPFIPIEAMRGHPTLTRLREFAANDNVEAARDLAGGTFARDSSWFAGRIFNSRIATVAPYAIRGAIWYQGESNCGIGEDPRDYSHKMRAMIDGWRSAWEQPNLPFYYVQLPQWPSYAWTYLREEQSRALDTQYTGMAITIDLDNDNDIHPPNKIDVGERLARWPLLNEYGFNIATTGPTYVSAQFESNTAIVRFENIGEGLTTGMMDEVASFRPTHREAPTGFELYGNEEGWHRADAQILDQSVIVTSAQVANPIAVRYACRPQAEEGEKWNLYNHSGLPAAPFCSDWSRMEYDPLANPIPN